MAQIMLIEDDITMLSLLKTLLEIEGHQVIKYMAEDDLLEPIRRSQPDMILLDVHYRRINGLDIMRAIRQDPQLSGIRVIMASGQDVAAECKAAGADDFLLKPFMPEHLIQRLETRTGQ
jgi:CheY-like chemotaxis protein